MRFLDEYRDADIAQKLLSQIQAVAEQRAGKDGSRFVLMEVCGGQTHGLLRHGIDEALEDHVELIHGPGCPICVTPEESIDLAQQLCLLPDVTLTSFGDMLRVPGSHQTLLDSRMNGGSLQIVYSPLDAVELAQQQPERHVVFFAVGFETTAPATAIAVQQAKQLGLSNFSLLTSHVRVQPAMELLAASPNCRVEGFLAAGHVCTVTGFANYQSFVERFRLPVVVTGFEPVDLLRGILRCVQMLAQNEHGVENQYARSARQDGNQAAVELIDQVYEVCDQEWRGFGVIPNGGLRLTEKFEEFDARKRFSELAAEFRHSNEESLSLAGDECSAHECQLGDILTGRIRPDQCEAFATRCTPERPLGAPMVSDEGACSAYYRYRRPTLPTE